MENVPNTYDQVHYSGFPYDQTHPDRLATLATLFGMSPTPIERCRVLELGCGDGSNLIPMAFDLPGSEFVGMDLAETPIAMGRNAIRELGLTNLRLEQADIMTVPADLGKFDYIIAHGVYSWVPEPVRDKLLAVAHHHLAPQGVAYVSYNALPGCQIRGMLRDMMLRHLGDVHDPEARIESALKFLEFLQAAPENKESLTVSFMVDEVKSLFERNPNVLFHDELSDFWYPSYFSDFVAHAGRHGLQYLSEANYFDMQPARFSNDLRAAIEEYSAGSRVASEQYMDFLKCRKFRQTLLCHAGLRIPDDVTSDRIRSLFATSSATPVSTEPDLRAGVAEEFRGNRGAAMKTAHPVAKAAIAWLTLHWPEAFSFDSLLARCTELTGEPADPEALAEILLATYRAGLVELHVHPPGCVSRPGSHPSTTPLARWQAQRGMPVTTLRHTTIEPTGDVERQLLRLLDGTRDREALAAAISPLVDPPLPAESLLNELETNLTKLAKFGLLTQ